MRPSPHGPGLRATAPPPARRPPPRAAALRLPLPGDRGLPRGAGGPRRALPRPVQGLAPALRGPDALPVRDGGGRRLRPRGAAARARPAARRQPRPSSAWWRSPWPSWPAARPAAWLFPVVYVWVGIFGVLAPAQVWTLANYVLTPREARRLFGFVGAGATLGATVGGVLSSAVARLFGAESLLVLVSALLLLATRARARPLAEAARDGRRLRPRPPVAARAAGQPPAGAGLSPPAGDRRDRGALLVRDRGRGLAVQGHGAAGARHAGRPGRLLRHVQRVGGRAVRGDAGAPDRRRPAAVRAGPGPLPPAGRPPLRVGGAPRLRHPRGRRAPQGRRQGAALLDRPARGGAALPARAARGEAPREVVHRHRGVAGRRRPRRPRGDRLRHDRRAGARPSRPRDAAVHRPVAGPGLAGAPALRGHAAREPAAAPPRRRARHDGGARPGDDRGARRPARGEWTRRRSCTPST